VVYNPPHLALKGLKFLFTFNKFLIFYLLDLHKKEETDMQGQSLV